MFTNCLIWVIWFHSVGVIVLKYLFDEEVMIYIQCFQTALVFIKDLPLWVLCNLLSFFFSVPFGLHFYIFLSLLFYFHLLLSFFFTFMLILSSEVFFSRLGLFLSFNPHFLCHGLSISLSWSLVISHVCIIFVLYGEKTKG